MWVQSPPIPYYYYMEIYMTSLALQRPTYIQRAKEYTQQERDSYELGKFLKTPEGREACESGQNALVWKRVLVKGCEGYRLCNLPCVGKGHECSYPKGSLQAMAWEEGFGAEAQYQQALYGL